MACKEVFTIKGITTGLGSELNPIVLGSISNPELGYSKEQFIQDLMNLPKNLLEQIAKLLNIATQLAKEELAPLKISSVDKRTAIHALTSHLKTLGVNIQEHTREEMNKLFPNVNADALTENGIIHICMDADITAPMHEMLHLVFGVMRATDFNQYEKIMNLISRSNMFEQIYNKIANVPEYKYMMELDRKEEAFIRLYEKLLNDSLNDDNLRIDNLVVDNEQIFDKINTMLIPYIQETFGIENVSGVIRFFLDSISNLPIAGSTLFLRPKLSTTGYSEHIQKITIRGKITNLILNMATPDIDGKSKILEVECK